MSGDFDATQFVPVFLEECGEHLATLEGSLLDLERRPDDDELLSRLFRAAHSIKGGAGMFGFATIARLTHGLESVLDAMREHTLVANPELIELLLRGTDAVQGLLAAITSGTAEPPIDHLLERCTAALAGIGHGVGPAAAVIASVAPVEPPAPVAPAARRLRVEVTPGRDVYRRGLDPMLSLRELAQMGAISDAHCDASALPALATLDPDSSYLAWSLVLATERPIADVEEALAFIAEGGRVRVFEETPAPAPIATPAPVPVPVTVIAPVVEAAAPRTRAPSSPPATGAPARAAAPVEQAASIRVAIDKVDKLMNLVGELVINQSMVAQAVNGFTPDKLARLREAVGEMERNTRELQERVMAIRMVPVASVFSRVPRLVRDLAGQLGKRVEVELVGEETELDKGVVERLADPLTHLVRNALDHGIETPDARIDAGKPPTGVLRLEAYHRGGSVIIEISDDGRGLDLARIKAKAIERGVIGPEQVLTEPQICALIFAPGFSTATTVSAVSGRGVGMDVVKRNVESLNGSISIDNRPGQGACFRIALPLTLAILDGLCLSAGRHVYVLPLTAIVESLRPRAGQIRKVLGRGEVIEVRDEILPLVRLHELFDLADCVTDPCAGLVVLVEDHGRKVGLLVDDIVSQAQVVIKSLETHLRRIEGLMGATILGDGQVALILDVQRLVRVRALGDGAPWTASTSPASEPAGVYS